MYKHSIEHRVTYKETDQMGVVYYANYLKFTERARTDLLRGLDINQQKMMTEDGLNFVVRDCRIEYLNTSEKQNAIATNSRSISFRSRASSATTHISRNRRRIRHF